MNREWVLHNLHEAAEELSQTISEIEATASYHSGEPAVALGHLYHHLNTAWNSKDVSAERVSACSDDDFHSWRRFPDDIVM